MKLLRSPEAEKKKNKFYLLQKNIKNKGKIKEKEVNNDNIFFFVI